MGERFPDEVPIPVDRLAPPLSRVGPLPFVREQRDAPDIFEASFDSVMLSTWYGQAITRGITNEMAGIPHTPGLPRDRVQPGYNVYRDEDLSDMEPYIDELRDVFSHAEFQSRKYQIMINQDLRHDLSEYPITHFLAAGVLDPINLIPVPLVLGKGFLAGARRAAAINAPLVAGTEAYRVSLDPTAEPMEVLYSTMGAMLFSGLIGGLAGKYKGPIGKMTVSDALNILVPLDKPITAEAGMFNWVRFLGKGGFRRIHDRLRATDSSGGNKSDAWTERVSVERVDSPDGLDMVSIRLDGQEFGFGVIRGGDTIHITSVELPKPKRGKGVGTAGYKAVIRYAEEHGLKVVSDTQTSPSAAAVWKKLEDEGFNIETNKTSELEDALDGEQVWMSGDSRPNFEVKPQLVDQVRKIPESLKLDEAEYKESLAETMTTIKRIETRLKHLREQLGLMTNNKGGRKTKQKARIKEGLEDLRFANGARRIHEQQLADTNAKMAMTLDEKVAIDWDLLPTGYNKILSNMDQFPFWVLMKSPLKTALPEVNRRMQLYALRMASTPGINTKGHTLGHAAGRSVESSAPVHFAGFVSAKKLANQLYLKYIGLGDDTGGFAHYSVDQGQRVRGIRNTVRKVAGLDEKPVAPEGKLTMEQFDNEITLAILQKGEHSIHEVAEASSHYIKWIEEVGDAARKEGLFATQKTLARKIEWLKVQRDKAKKAMWHTIDKDGNIKLKEGQEPNSFLNDVELELMHVEEMLEAYSKAGSNEIGGTGWIHRIWRKDDVIAKEGELKAYLHKAFTEDPFEGKTQVRIDDELVTIDLTDPDAITARVDEAYASILKEAEHGGDGEFVVTSTDKADWLNKRLIVLQEKAKTGTAAEKKNAALRMEIIEFKLDKLEKGQGTNGGGSALIGRKLDLDDTILHDMGVIERGISQWGQHYAMRMAPLIETSRIFGDSRATKEIGEIYSTIKAAARDAIRDGDHAKGKMLNKEAERTLTATQDLRDIVQGVYGIPDDPSAITGRVLRLLRNINLISAMGRSTLMAFGDTGNVMISQGFTNTNRQLLNHFRRGLTNGSIKMMEDEVRLAGSAVEVVMAQRFHQLTELGGAAPRTGSRFNKLEIGAQNAAQRFFLHNMMAPWTDMMRKVSGSMLQSKIISNAHAFKDGTISKEDIKVMARLGIDKTDALRMLDHWKRAGSLKHEDMFIANTEGWNDDELVMLFRSAMNTEINRMVPTPGAADKPKGLLKSEWWKVIGQYRGFSIGATHRIMAAGLQTNSAHKWSGVSAMIGIAMMVDAWKRPDYIDLPLEEAVLRAVELSGVTGVLLDGNDTIERASDGAIGLRPAFGMDIRERDPNWATRLGTAGAVPNQLLTLLYAFGSEDADTADRTRALRYMTPYNNLIWWNEYVNRIQRATTEFIED
jgi:GNAT superfamily N-acetyltransferase